MQTLSATGSPSPLAAATPEMHRVARDLEAAFLSEVLKSSGLGARKGGFGGGTGEDQFVSLLNQEYASAMADVGGIGLAEHIVRAMARAVAS